MPELDLILQSQEKGRKEQAAILENNVEATIKTTKAVEELKPALEKIATQTAPKDIPKDAQEVIVIAVKKGDKGDPADPKEVATELAKSGSKVIADELAKNDAFKAEVKGDPGKEAKADEVAQALLGDTEFLAKVKGEPGTPPTLEQVTEALMANQAFREAVKGDPGDDATPPTPQAVAAVLANSEAFVRSLKGEPGSPDTGDQIVAKINEAKDEIQAGKISGFAERVRAIRGPGGGSSKDVNLNELTDVSIPTEPADGDVLVYSSATKKWSPATLASGSFTVLTTASTIDDSNLDFTFAAATGIPQFLVINGAWYPPAGGAITWSWDSGTLTATLSSPIGSGGAIFAIQ